MQIIFPFFSIRPVFLKVGRIAPLGRFWWARGRKNQRGR